LEEINHRRHDYTRLGFGYQLAFVRLCNWFPAQEPLEIVDEVLTFVSLHLGIADHHIQVYGKRRKTVSEHQELIRHYLGLRLFSSALPEVEAFVFRESYSLEQTGALTARVREFLKQNRILEPSQDTIQRIIQTQREAARTAINDRIYHA
jgi:hypothetical protein